MKTLKEIGSTIKAIVFDIDGVIVLGSESGKRAAWEKLFEPGTKEAKAVREARLKALESGGNRFTILRRAGEIVGHSGDVLTLFVDKAAERFNQITLGYYEYLGVNQHDVDALCLLAEKYQLFTNSATPVEAQEEVFGNILHINLFTGLYGAPEGKVEALGRIMKDYLLIPEQVLFVGDDDKDVRAAENVGCRFVGRTNDWNRWDSIDSRIDFPLVFSLTELSEGLLAAQ